MKHLITTLFTSLFCAGLFAQTFIAKNSFTAGNVGTDDIRDIATDANPHRNAVSNIFAI